MDYSKLLFSGGHYLSLLTFSPLLGIFALFFVPPEKEKTAREIAIASGLLTFVLSLFLLHGFSPADGFQFAERSQWYPALGATYTMAVDGISFWFILLTSFLTLLVLIASTSVHKRVRAYLGCMLLLEIGMLGTFLALDGLTFYVFWELMLIPMYFLIGIWGGTRRIYAAVKFVLYTAFGSLLMLVAIVYLAYSHYLQYGNYSFALADWMKLSLSLREQLWLFSAFALAFSIKIPLFPFHTWLPDAHVEAPTGGSVILAGVLLKMGLYGLIRFCLPVFPDAMLMAAPIFAVLGVVGIIYGALVAWVQTDMKKLVAYSSVSHLGFCVLGFAALNLQGLQGSLLQMLNHGVSTSALFLLVGVLYDRKHTRMIAEYGGLAAKIPVFAAVFLVFTLSSVGLPLTNGFIGEFLIMLGGFMYERWLGAAATLGVILGAVYMLSLYRRVSFGTLDEKKNGDMPDLTGREKLVFIPLLVLVFFIGLYPQPILSKMQPASEQLLSTLYKVRTADRN
jgi:NADH-quinone oxidoreductase subunit M